MQRRFQQVDVFAAEPFLGNPLAVVVDAKGLSGDEMLAFTRWMNLSESAFLLPPTDEAADYRVRIFTLAGELPFAGHPTLGSCHAWLTSGGVPRDPQRIVQECGAGLIPLRRDEAGLAFAAPPQTRTGPVESAYLADVLDVLGLPPDAVEAAAWTDNGPGWLSLRLDSAARVLGVEADSTRWHRPESLDVGLVALQPEGSDTDVEVRALFSDDRGGIIEDPVTGSLNAALGQWLFADDLVPNPYTASQGTCIGRRGRPRVNRDDAGAVWVGGPTTTFITGTVEL